MAGTFPDLKFLVSSLARTCNERIPGPSWRKESASPTRMKKHYFFISSFYLLWESKAAYRTHTSTQQHTQLDKQPPTKRKFSTTPRAVWDSNGQAHSRPQAISNRPRATRDKRMASMASIPAKGRETETLHRSFTAISDMSPRIHFLLSHLAQEHRH